MFKKLSKNELASLDNIADGIKNIQKKECVYTAQKILPTCLLSNDNIYKISYFLSHKLPKCKKLGLTLNNIRKGNIISKGSFGYSFNVTKSDDTSTVIKIIMCNKKEDMHKLMSEIETHSKLSKLDDEYAQYFIKLYGYFKNEPISSHIGAKTAYKYYDIINTNTYSCIFPTKNLQNNCEMYLLLEGGKIDLHRFIKHLKSANNRIYDIINLFFDFLNFYKVNEHFIKTENKFFIHCDIKPLNLVIVVDKDKKSSIKFIDFGLSKFSDDFIDSSGRGTDYMYEYLLTYKEDKKFIKYMNLIHSSPLTDIYIVLQSCFEVIICGLRNVTFKYNYSHEQIIETIKIIAKDISDIEVKKKIYRMMNLADVIYKFYQIKLKLYHEDKYTISDPDFGQININKREHPNETHDMFLYSLHSSIRGKPNGYKNSQPEIIKVTTNDYYNFLHTYMQYILYDEYNLSESVA
jgi:thiamine kinase-like enzyme